MNVKVNAYLCVGLHGFSSKTKQNLYGVGQFFLLGFRINLSCACRVRVNAAQN